MLSTTQRIDLLVKLGEYISSNNEQWIDMQYRAINANTWFTLPDIQLAANSVATQFLVREKLKQWITQYKVTEQPRNVGIIAAGNIPMVGFHDMLCGFISGHNVGIKLSSKDEVLLKHLIAKLAEWEPQVAQQIQVADMLKGYDAYIATGSNNSARYFEQYFAKYPHIIRKNRTSVAILDGTETPEELHELGKDIFQYLGLGCRNVTQVYLPRDYQMHKLFEGLAGYADVINHHKYKNNYDYHLAIYLLNKVKFLSNDFLLVVENEVPFSAVSVLHYQFYDNVSSLNSLLKENADIQAIVGHGNIPFGKSQQPELTDYADGIDTMKFLESL